MALTRTPPDRWIEEGLRALADGGPEAVRIEPLAQALGVSKGGFYWQFDDRGALLESMLDSWERATVDDVIERVEGGGGDAREKLRRLFAIAGREPLRTELAVRDWARRDRTVGARLRRVDNRRMDYMRGAVRGSAAAMTTRSRPAACSPPRSGSATTSSPPTTAAATRGESSGRRSMDFSPQAFQASSDAHERRGRPRRARPPETPSSPSAGRPAPSRASPRIAIVPAAPSMARGDRPVALRDGELVGFSHALTDGAFQAFLSLILVHPSSLLLGRASAAAWWGRPSRGAAPPGSTSCPPRGRRPALRLVPARALRGRLRDFGSDRLRRARPDPGRECLPGGQCRPVPDPLAHGRSRLRSPAAPRWGFRRRRPRSALRVRPVCVRGSGSRSSANGFGSAPK